jgi:hypothetical protein
LKRMTAFSLLGLLALALPAVATDFPEVEPNDSFPPTTTLGPFASGDRMTGSITAGDVDLHYLQVTGPGVPGLYRYDFHVNTDGDSFLALFDSTPDGFLFGVNDDFDGFASQIFFDHFDPTGADTTWGVDVEGFSIFDEFDYALSVTRTLTPVTGLGSLPVGVTSTTGTTESRASWYSFTTTGEPVSLTVDTNGGPDEDTEIVIFDSNGNTVGGDDDDGDGFLSSHTLNGLAKGTYYVAVGQFNSLYNWDTFDDVPLGWDRNGIGFAQGFGRPSPIDFQLNITYSAVPEPGTWALLLGGLVPVAGLIARRRRA